MARKQHMPFREAMDLVSDDMPDGAFWAMAHDIAGLEYGDGFDELLTDETRLGRSENEFACKKCGKIFRSGHARYQHTRDKHGKLAQP